MSLAIVHTRANIGMDAPLVTVETHLSNGLPGMSIVGLPETVVRESRERVRSAILNAGMAFPARRMTINLAPADLPKSGGRFDLAIALGILAASGQVPASALEGCEILGELALTGELRPVAGILPAVLAARDSKRTLLLPAANMDEASLVEGVSARGAGDLLQVCRHLAADGDGQAMEPCRFRATPEPVARAPGVPDLRDIRGQPLAKRALQIAAAGAHNLLLIGPPGTGKTMLANALYSLLPRLPEAEALETAAIRSIARQPIDAAGWRLPAFRSPHHSATSVALVGGGRNVSPGEVTLAHHGLLFLDELTEFSRHVLESLREPLESGVITVARASYRLRFPARFQLVAAMNPCPCGYHGDPGGLCRCTPERIERYLEKISGPLLDRIDMIIDVPRVEQALLLDEPAREEPGSDCVRRQVEQCRRLQRRRGAVLNSDLSTAALERYARPDRAGRAVLEGMMEHMRLSARACHRLLRIARTVADLAGEERVHEAHIAEAVACRSATLDRGNATERFG